MFKFTLKFQMTHLTLYTTPSLVVNAPGTYLSSLHTSQRAQMSFPLVSTPIYSQTFPKVSMFNYSRLRGISLNGKTLSASRFAVFGINLAERYCAHFVLGTPRSLAPSTLLRSITPLKLSRSVRRRFVSS